MLLAMAEIVFEIALWDIPAEALTPEWFFGANPAHYFCLSLPVIFGLLGGRVGATTQGFERANSLLQEMADQLELQRQNLEGSRTELEAALEKAEAARQLQWQAVRRYETLFKDVPVACFTADIEGHIFEWNAAAEQLWGLEGHTVFQKVVWEALDDGDSAGGWQLDFEKASNGRSFVNVEREAIQPDGSRRLSLASGFPFRDRKGNVVGVLCAAADVTDLVEAEEALRRSEEKYRQVVETVKEVIFAMDVKGRWTYLNPAWTEITGFSVDDSIGRPCLDFVPREDLRADLKRFRKLWREPAEAGRHEVRCLTASGEVRWLELHPRLNFGLGGKASGITGTLVDVTDRKLAEMALAEANGRLEAQATVDGLTGLKNHRAFQDHLEEQFQHSIEYGRPLSLLLLDVDHFKSYNDAFGHQAGDEALRFVGRALADKVAGSEFLARYGGEEIAVVLPGEDAVQAFASAERFRAAVESTSWPRKPLTVSVGVATLRPLMAGRADLIQAADEALYASKSAGRNRSTHADAQLQAQPLRRRRTDRRAA